MEYLNQNWAFNEYIKKNGERYNPREFPIIQEGDIFVSCNLTRFAPETDLFRLISDLTFIDCNLINVKIKDSWLVDNETCVIAENTYQEEEPLPPRKS